MSDSALALLVFLGVVAVAIPIGIELFLALMVLVGVCMTPVVILVTALGNLVRHRYAEVPSHERRERHERRTRRRRRLRGGNVRPAQGHR